MVLKLKKKACVAGMIHLGHRFARWYETSFLRQDPLEKCIASNKNKNLSTLQIPRSAYMLTGRTLHSPLGIAVPRPHI